MSNRQLAPLIRELVLELPKDQPFDFRAGGFLQMTAPPYDLDFSTIEVDDAFRDIWRLADWPQMRSSSAVAVTRAYSIANRPEDVGRAVFNIRLAVPPAGQEQEVPPGVVSSWLFARRPGDKVEASGPFGDFHVQPTQREMVFIGGGVGMAPLREMIHEQIGAGTDRKMRFFYGARARRLICSMSMSLRRLRRRSEFHMDTGAFRSRARRPLAGATGFIHDTVRAAMSKHPAPEDCEYYLCGPPIMISAVLHTLAKLGVEPASIFNDDFGG